MILTLIAAMSENRVIGAGGDLPWRLPDDMRHFMRTTRGWPVIMGRRTWDTMPGGEPLKDRHNLVVTRQADHPAAGRGATVVGSLDAAIERAAADVGEGDPVFVIGGGEIYRLALPKADRLDLTIVHAEIEGDTEFPAWDPADWRLVSETPHAADERHAHAFTFRMYERG